VKKFITYLVTAFAFVFVMNFVQANVDLYVNSWLKNVSSINDLGIFSRPALLYYHLPNLFWLQNLAISSALSLWLAFYLIIYRKKQ